MVEKYAPGDNAVDLPFADRTEKLEPTLRACIAISRINRGIQTTVQRIYDGDFDTIAEVIAIGLNRTNTSDLHEEIYQAGVMNLRSPLIRFVSIVNNGGHLPDVDEEEEDSKSGKKQ